MTAINSFNQVDKLRNDMLDRIQQFALVNKSNLIKLYMIRVMLIIGILISNIFLSFGQMNSKRLTYSSGVEVGGLAFSDNNIGAYAGLVMYKKNAM